MARLATEVFEGRQGRRQPRDQIGCRIELCLGEIGARIGVVQVRWFAAAEFFKLGAK